MSVLGVGLVVVVGGMILTGNGQVLADFAKKAVSSISDIFNNLTGKEKTAEEEIEQENADNPTPQTYISQKYEYETNDFSERKQQGLIRLASNFGMHDDNLIHCMLKTENMENKDYSHSMANYLTSECGWRVTMNGAVLNQTESREYLESALSDVNKKDNGLILNILKQTINGEITNPERNVDFYRNNAMEELEALGDGNIVIDNESALNGLAIDDTINKTEMPFLSPTTSIVMPGNAADSGINLANNAAYDQYINDLTKSFMENDSPYRIDENDNKQELTEKELKDLLKKSGIYGILMMKQAPGETNDIYLKKSELVYTISNVFDANGVNLTGKEKYRPDKENEKISLQNNNSKVSQEVTEASNGGKTTKQSEQAKQETQINPQDIDIQH